jgi:hypothetical protein
MRQINRHHSALLYIQKADHVLDRRLGHCVVESFAYSRPRLLVDQFDLTEMDIDLGAAIKLDCCPAQSIFAERDLDVGIGRLTDQSAGPINPTDLDPG